MEPEQIHGKNCVVFARSGRVPLSASFKYPGKPRFVKSLRTADIREARAQAARMYWLLHPGHGDEIQSLDFVWSYWAEKNASHKRLKTIRWHMEAKWSGFFSGYASMEASPVLEKEIKEYCQSRIGEGISKKTVLLELSSLRQVLRFAKKMGLIESVVSLPETLAPEAKPKEPYQKKIDTPLTKAFVRKLPKMLDNWAREPSLKAHQRYARIQLKYACLFMASTGIAPRTLRSMRNYCVRFDNGNMAVMVSLERGGRGKKPCWVVARFLGDASRAEKFGKEWIQAKKGKEPEDFLFANYAGGEIGISLSQLFTKFLRQQGVDTNRQEGRKRISLLALRHVFLNECLREGEPRPKYGVITTSQAPKEFVDNSIPPARDFNETPLPPHIRFANYKGKRNWGVILKEEQLAGDLAAAQLSRKEWKRLRTKDFEMCFVPKEDKAQVQEIREFLAIYEHLGTVATFTTHRFAWRLNLPGKPKILCGVVCYSSPNKSQDYLSDGMSQGLEKMISRGASNSLCPKNMGSYQLSESLRWMAKNTKFRFYSGMSDPSARERGVIYSASRFYYMGDNFGTRYEHLTKTGWKPTRYFYERSSFLRYARRLKIQVKPEWLNRKDGRTRIDWAAVPDAIEKKLKGEADNEVGRHKTRRAQPKRKWVYVLGASKKETKRLRRSFEEVNAHLPLLDYPSNS